MFYDCEEIEYERNGLTRIQAEYPEWLAADLAILGEPTNGQVEAGCQGNGGGRHHDPRPARRTRRDRGWGTTRSTGRRPCWTGSRRSTPGSWTSTGASTTRDSTRSPITGGVASNVIPDECVVRVNFRFAPDRSPQDAVAVLQELFVDVEMTVLDVAAGALPGLSAPAAAEFVAAAGGSAEAKFGWTDVSRFAALGIPAVNYGPGDPSLAHTREEWVSMPQIREMTEVLRSFLR